MSRSAAICRLCLAARLLPKASFLAAAASHAAHVVPHAARAAHAVPHAAHAAHAAQRALLRPHKVLPRIIT